MKRRSFLMLAAGAGGALLLKDTRFTVPKCVGHHAVIWGRLPP